MPSHQIVLLLLAVPLAVALKREDCEGTVELYIITIIIAVICQYICVYSLLWSR